MFITCNVTSHDQDKKVPFDLISDSASPLGTILPSLLVIGIVEEEIVSF